MTTTPLHRRGFLRGLVTLPLIGGAVSLLGSPTAAAVPTTDELHERYLTWLAHEHQAAVREHCFRSAFSHALRNPHGDETPMQFAIRCRDTGMSYMGWIPEAPDVARLVALAAPSSRAALVLSAVGCDWGQS